MTRRGLAVWLVALCVGGCKLVDQTTFGVPPAAPAPDELSEALRAGSGIPLVVIRIAPVAGDTIAPVEGDTIALLRRAVDMAEARRPGAQYDIATVVPAQGRLDEQVAAARQGEAEAADVMATLAELGVSEARMRLQARTDPGLSGRELRIYVH